MSDKNVIIFSNKNIANTQNSYSTTRARSFGIKTSELNFAQYLRTVKAYALAGMTFNHIANAGDFLEDKVERKEVDVPLKQGLQNRVGEVAEDESKILAWQTRGEKVSLTHQLSSPQSVTGQEMVIISKEIATTGPDQEKIIDVIEGIKVSLDQNTPSLKNSPFLQPITGGLDKAA